MSSVIIVAFLLYFCLYEPLHSLANLTFSFFTLFSVSLKPEVFEGFRFDFNKGLNQNFSLSHRY